MTFPASSPQNDPTLVTEVEVRRMLGGVSHMLLWRLDHDAASGFPAPVWIGRRKFRPRAALCAWIENRPNKPEGKIGGFSREVA